MRPIAGLLRRRRAQSMVEFTLVIPVLIMLILGIIELGYALFIYTEVENAAREGARAAAVRPCPNVAARQEIIDATRARLPALVDRTTIVPIVSYPDGSKDYGDAVVVTIEYPFQLLDPLLSAVIPVVRVHAVASRTMTTGCGGPTTPQPTPPATPTQTMIGMCIVPNFINARASAAIGTWRAAHFTGSVIKIGSSNFRIVAQSLPSGSSQPCASDITVSDAPLPTSTPTSMPTSIPTNAPTNTPTSAPTSTPVPPTSAPTNTPTSVPTSTPTDTPTSAPTNTPTSVPTSTPTNTPTSAPTRVPTSTPTSVPTNTPTRTNTPTNTPTASPTQCPALGATVLTGMLSGNSSVIHLSWNAVTGATSYQVYRATTATGPFTLWTTIPDITVKDDIPANNTYRYYVVAINICNQPGALSNIVTITR